MRRNVVKFTEGQSDCEKGLESKLGEHEDYYAGYEFQYALEQSKTHISERGLGNEVV